LHLFAQHFSSSYHFVFLHSMLPVPSAGARVALRNDSYALHILLPSKIDPLVSLMKVEKVPDSTYDMIGGCDQQIKEIKEVSWGAGTAQNTAAAAAAGAVGGCDSRVAWMHGLAAGVDGKTCRIIGEDCIAQDQAGCGCNATTVS
jgi:hypothetical protein